MSGWEGAKGASVPPVPRFEPSAELEQGLALEMQNIESLAEQQLAALQHESRLIEQEAWQHEVSLREEEADLIEQEEAALMDSAPAAEKS